MIPTQRAHLYVAAKTHSGMSGKNNEDRFAISSFVLSREDPTPALFAIVSDGIGGHRAGEVAAEMAVNAISQAVADSDGRNPQVVLGHAIQATSETIRGQAETGMDQKGMGATCACVWVIGTRLYTASVGDSRIYLLREGAIHQLTVDHTWVQEAIEKGILTPDQARDHPNVHVIRRHLGSLFPPVVDFRLKLDREEGDESAEHNQGLSLQAGDVLLLCTDGLTDLVWDDEILREVSSAHNLDLAAKALIDLANQRGGHDNITTVLISVPPHAVAKRKSWLPWIFGGVGLLATLLLAGSLLAINLIYPSKRETRTALPGDRSAPLVTDQAHPEPVTVTPYIDATGPGSAPLLPGKDASPAGPTYTPWPTNTP